MPFGKIQHRILYSVLFYVFFVLVNVSAQAADIRFRANDSYDRLVLDWKQPVTFKAVSESNGALVLQFNTNISPDGSDLNAGNFRYFNSLDVTKDGASVKASFKGAATTRYRYFKIGTKIIVDVSGTVLKNTASNNVTATQTKEVPTPVATPKTVEKVEASPTIAVEREALTPIQNVSTSDLVKDGTITVSSTQAFGMSAYVQHGILWLVSDQPDMVLSPQIQGPAAEWLGQAEKVELKDATIFMYEWPFPENDAYIRAEGGGLLWRFSIDGKTRLPQQGSIRSYIAEGEHGDSKKNVSVELAGLKKLIKFSSPLTGEVVHVVTVNRSNTMLSINREFVDFSIIPALAGGAIQQKNNNLDVRKDPERENVFIISTPKGLAFSEESFNAYNSILSDLAIPETEVAGKIYDFTRWARGGLGKMDENREAFERQLSALEPEDPEYVSLILLLAKLHLGNVLPHEALGYFSLAEDMLENMRDNPEYQALLAAANTLSGRNLEAQSSFNAPALKDLEEIQYWKAYNFGRLEKWDEAYKAMPKEIKYINNYPARLRQEVALMLAEVALRAQDGTHAGLYLDLVQQDGDGLLDPYLSSYRYLLGELRRQEGDSKGAAEIWERLFDEGDKLYRAKAGLAWAKLALSEQSITPEKGVEILEQLRFTWRGDGLETQINHQLGLTYIEMGDYKKGLSILRDMASNTEDDTARFEIVQDMQKSFASLFLGEPSKDLTAIQAVTLYDAFSELLPPGQEGTNIIFALLDKLVAVDLMDRAEVLLKQLIGNRLTGIEKDRATIRLARLQLLNDHPKEALATLADVNLVSSNETKRMIREKTLIEAKALAENGQTRAALDKVKELGNTQEADQLTADISWSKQSWNEAAAALKALVLKKGLAQKESLSNEEAKLILNTAVAINLSNDLQGLQFFQARFEDKMDATAFGRLFKIVTRPPGNAFLSSRETILDIVQEVDLFEGILDQF